jgi:hypothetical protein
VSAPDSGSKVVKKAGLPSLAAPSKLNTWKGRFPPAETSVVAPLSRL